MPFIFAALVRDFIKYLFMPHLIPRGVEEFVPDSGELTAPLDYLIGTDSPPQGRDGRVMETSYDVNAPRSAGASIAYCNLFDEKNTGKYGPYLHTSDTANQYNEGQIDPSGPGWKQNLTNQYERRKKSGFKYVELDNPDAYDTDDVIRAINLAKNYGLMVIAKNADICSPDAVSYLKHSNVYGHIVEKGAGTPVSCDNLRKRAGKPDLPTWFVFFGGTKAAAQETARIIQQKKFSNMWVSYSRKGEYGSSEDV